MEAGIKEVEGIKCGTWVPLVTAARLKNVSPLTVQKRYYTNEVEGMELGDMLLICLDGLDEGSGKVGRPPLQ